jgi:hypothetical protein
MSTPVFAVGDEVECEASARCDSTPRWDYLDDAGGCGVWLVGKVTEANADHIVVDFNSEEWSWPSTQDKDYRPDQWKRPGYLRHKQAVQPMRNPCREINLGVQPMPPGAKLFFTNEPKANPTRAQWLGRENTNGCECGAWVSGGLHSSWCCCSGGCK